MSEHAAAHPHWHAEPWPFLVGFGGFFFLPWAFMFQYVYAQGLIATVALAIGVLMLLVGGIGWVGATIGIVDDEGWSPSAMLMFIGTEIMTVLGLLVAYWTVRVQAPVWPPAGTPEISIPIVAVLILLVSSFTIGMARKNEKSGDANGFAVMTLVSMGIWVVFAVMTIMNWNTLGASGFSINTNLYGTALYGLTGIHFAHIIFGLCIMAMSLPAAFKGRLSPSYSRSMTMYVHFVNILSIWVLAQVYFW